MTLKVEIETKVPSNFFQIFASIGFWNAEGKTVYEANKAGTMGSQFTQEQAKKLQYQDFVFNSLLTDIQTILEKTDFKFGKAGSHIWVSDKDNKRILFIHF